MEVSGQIHASAALPPGNNSCHPLDRRFGGPQSRSGRDVEEKIPNPRQESKPGTPIFRSPALYRLSSHGSGKHIFV